MNKGGPRNIILHRWIWTRAANSNTTTSLTQRVAQVGKKQKSLRHSAFVLSIRRLDAVRALATRASVPSQLATTWDSDQETRTAAVMVCGFCLFLRQNLVTFSACVTCLHGGACVRAGDWPASKGLRFYRVMCCRDSRQAKVKPKQIHRCAVTCHWGVCVPSI